MRDLRRLLRILAVLTLPAAFNAVPLYAGVNTVVAEVNGVKLTERDLSGVLDEILPMASYHQAVSQEKMAERRKEALEELVKRELYYQDAKGKLKVKRSEVKKLFSTVKKRFKNRKEFGKALKAGGHTEKSYRKFIERSLLVKKYYEEEVVEKAKVSDEFLRDQYEKNRESYVRPESLRIRHIVIKIAPEATKEERERERKRAEEVVKKAKAGEDFAQLAWDYSMGEFRVKGGDIGIIHKGRLLPEIEDAAFKLKVGEVSDVVETIYGYHIVKTEEKFPPTPMTFDEVKEKLRKDFEEKRTKERKEALLKRLKENAEIKVYDGATGQGSPGT